MPEDDFWNLLSEETNKFADTYIKSPTTSKTDFTNEWFDATADKMRAYFSLCVLMTQVKKNKIEKYWSPWRVTETTFFGKISSIIDYVNTEIDYVQPTKKPCLDESLMKFRGRLCYIQYNPNKGARFGIKFYKICESFSGYCMQFSIYTGKKQEIPKDVPSSEAVVLELMKLYLRMGYTVAMDSWYSSPDLFQKLAKEKTNALGTVHVNRKKHAKSIQKDDLKKRSSRQTKNCDGLQYSNEHSRQMISAVRYYCEVFFYVMDMVVYNTNVLYKKIIRKRIQFDDFREDLAEKILEGVKLSEYKRRVLYLVRHPCAFRLQTGDISLTEYHQTQ
ncbi:hypothetical protein J437_LFUL017675 [Ladona fulva]|uniref:PiggyBac transposable element-derived protein domain-containing protein n=1 Tax=Ladona fulva TaxID=123851 RepID=A0A8K0KP16_LADFU|nr:hypothetical protein J437_LFUL017675 [Ladona fulva]